MEPVGGVLITTWVRSREPPLRELIDLFRAGCEAVHHAHRNLIVHRDLKPSDLLISDDGSPRLLDFGIARLLPEQTGAAEPAVGAVDQVTPEYASPEQIRGDPVTTGSDVYSLGVLLYLLLSGRRPYEVDRARPGDMVRTICETRPADAARASARLSETQ